MPAKEYMRINKDKTVTIDFNKYSGNGFIDAVKIRDIAKATILGREKRKKLGRGAPDVLMQYASGGTERISRKKLINDYLTKSGKKIRIAYLKANTPYLVISNKPQNYGIILLPSNMKGILNGKVVPPGYYIVAPKNQNGEIDSNKLTVISGEKFKKMFKIPPQDIIINNMSGKGHKASRRIISHMQNTNRNKQTVNKPVGNIGGNIGNIGGNIGNIGGNIGNTGNTGNIGGNIGNIGGNTMNTQKNVNTQQQKAKLKMVGRLFNSSTNELVGYLMIDSTGKQYKKSINDTMKLCNEHKIINAMLQRHPNGKFFLRGNAGTVIERLPKFIV